MDSSSKNEEGNSFIYIQPGSAEHEAMKESVIDIVRRRLEEWEALGLINGVCNKRNEELGEALNLDLVQTYEEMEKRIKEFIHLDWPQFEKARAGDFYSSLSDLLLNNRRKTGLE
ncbi:hypothetical protein ACH5RR_039274 [Cinchona calisaya]|uniref:Uncharacterized protein n=1 Tax=Cinchona calisaya TaxID=153742 RepID=A0ABD2XXR5_9GENT